MLKKLIGDKTFYKRLFALMLPIMVQNGVTTFVNMLDNIMIGATGTAQMTGVAVTNQLFFVFNLCIFGAVSGASIFGAQFFGNNDYEGVHHTFRFKLIFSAVITVAAIVLFILCGDSIIGMYMQGEQGITDPAATLGYAKDYMLIMLIGLIPFAIVQCYSSTLRESANPTLPMLAGIAAVFVNLVLNYILIFGNFGAPELGVSGAAIATVAARFIELSILVFGTHLNKKKYPFMRGVYRSLYVPKRLMARLFVKGLPLMINEALWATGVAIINQCYSVYGLDSVAAVNISQTFWNVFSISYIAVGASISIMLGQLLGANELDLAKTQSYRLIFTAFVLTLAVAIVYLVCAKFIPYAYNTEPQIRQLATVLMQISALAMPFEALSHASYFTLRSGGKMLITFIFDSVFMWCVNVPAAFVVSRYTGLPFVALFAIIQYIALIKGVFGIALVKKGAWIKNIIEKN